VHGPDKQALFSRQDEKVGSNRVLVLSETVPELSGTALEQELF
jgi:hypothetical protein